VEFAGAGRDGEKEDALRSLPLIGFLCAATAGGQAALAAHCEGVSHMSCVEGIDRSGRSASGLYDAAVEALREAQTPEQRALARKAMKDALNPAMSYKRAVLCNQAGGGVAKFQQCMKGPGPDPGLHMTIPCQQNLTDGRVLMDGRFLPIGAHYDILHYHPLSADQNGWTHGECEVAPASGALP
jgi:hypothetical protein